MITETFQLTIDDHVAALGGVVAARTDELLDGPIGRLDRIERRGWRAAAVGLPVLVAIPLLGQPGLRTYGWLALLAAPVLLLVVSVLERIGSTVERRLDSVGDGMIDRALVRGLQKDLERGTVRILLGEVTAIRDEDRIDVRSADHRVVIPDVRTAWWHRSETQLILASRTPSSRSSAGEMVILPGDGPIAMSFDADSSPSND